MRRCQRPRAVTAHAQAGQIHTILVHVILLNNRIQERIEHCGIPAATRTLRRDENEWERAVAFGELGQAVDFDLGEIAARLARAVQEEHERPTLFRFAVIGRQAQQVVQLGRDGNFLLKGFRLLRRRDRGLGLTPHGQAGGQEQGYSERKAFCFHKKVVTRPVLRKQCSLHHSIEV